MPEGYRFAAFAYQPKPGSSSLMVSPESTEWYLTKEAKELASKSSFALLELEGRTTGEALRIQQAIADEAWPNGYEAGDAAVAWELLVDSIIEDPPWGLHLDPPVTYAEVFLAAAILFAENAARWIESKESPIVAAGSHMLVYAYRSFDLWNHVRGETGCRCPDDRGLRWRNADDEFKKKLLSIEIRAESQAHGSSGANKRYDQPGGTRDNIRKLREAWQTGEYRSRNHCAKTLHERLGMAEKTARKHLIGVPRRG